MKKEFKYVRQQSLKDRIKDFGKHNIALTISVILGIIILTVNVVFMFISVAVVETVFAVLSILLGLFILVLSFVIALKSKELIDYFFSFDILGDIKNVALLMLLVGIINLFK